MKRKKTIKYHTGGTMGDDFTITVEANYGRAYQRHESKDHMEALTSRIVSALSQHSLVPITSFKTK